ncbi:MAG: GNAT family N-acetyltransferase [Clostridia bacterium]|nr:GNAT family N-acetyltransferase [Clostridia bacterium]
MEIRVAKKEENKKVITFLSKVFTRPFPRLIPSLYGKDKNMMDYHYLVEENGKLIGAVCAYPEDIVTSNTTIKGLAIGMVATLKSARGRGVMTSMLKHVDKEYPGVDVMFLTGRRHRYEHFGYYPAGACYSFLISSMSIKKWDIGCPFEVVEAKTENDYREVDELNNVGKLRVDKPLARESDTLRNWFSKLYLIKEQGKTVGFASGKFFKGHVLERIFIKDGKVQDYVQGVLAYKKYKGATNLKVDVLPHESALKEAMHMVSEEWSINSHEKYKVVNYARLIKKLLTVTLEEKYLNDFSFVVEIVGREKLLVSVKEGEAIVEESTQEPDLTLSEAQAIASLLGGEESIVNGMVKIALRHSDFI